jgi:hypothetical protein
MLSDEWLVRSSGQLHVAATTRAAQLKASSTRKLKVESSKNAAAAAAPISISIFIREQLALYDIAAPFTTTICSCA